MNEHVMKGLLLILIFLALLCLEFNSTACTAFCLKTSGGIYLAKNLDWEIDEGYLFFNEKGEEKRLLNAGNFRWKSKYRSITFNQFGKEFPLGGMNEQGLVVEELNVSTVKLIPDETRRRINEFQLVQYLLDNCKSVEETIHQLESFQSDPLFQPLHYIIADKSGNVIIAEFDGAVFNVYSTEENGYPVLSNNNYCESLKYLSYFRGFGGDLPIINRKGSNERFVTAAGMLKNYFNQPAVSYSFQVLDSVKQNDTRWSLVYDIKNLCIHFRFHACTTVKFFDFRDILKSECIAGLGGNLSDCLFLGNNELSTITFEENSKLIQRVFLLYRKEMSIDIDDKLLQKMSVVGNLNLPKAEIPAAEPGEPVDIKK